MAAPLWQKSERVIQYFSKTDYLLRQLGIERCKAQCKSCIQLRLNENFSHFHGTYASEGNTTVIFNKYSCTQFKGGNFHKLSNRGIPLIDSLASTNGTAPVPCLVNQKCFYTLNGYSWRNYSSDSSVNNDKTIKDVWKEDKTENIYTIPNFLTLSRVMLTPVIGVLVVQQSFPLALGLFTFAGITDWLDGYIARNFKNQMSTFGTAMDPLADKILVTVLTVTLTMANLLPMPLAVLIVGRDVLLVIAGFVIRYMSLPPPFTIRRYFDGTIPTVKLVPSTLSKVNTSLQLSLVCLTLAAPVFDFVDHTLLQCLWVVTGATTFGSGIDYVFNRHKYVKFLKDR